MPSPTTRDTTNIDKSKEDLIFLQGPASRTKEFFYVLRVAWQFIQGFRKLHFIGPCVTVFGSARIKEEHPFYQAAREISSRIGEMGFSIMTGGGPGIMEAANRGAKESGVPSIGCNIELPKEQEANPYLDITINFRYFFVRKVLLLKYSYAFVVMPGGVGTLDELFETITLIQTKKIRQFPIVLFGKEYWQHLSHLLDQMIEEKTISEEDRDLFLITDSIEEAVSHVEKVISHEFGLQRRKNAVRPTWWLGESFFHHS